MIYMKKLCFMAKKKTFLSIFFNSLIFFIFSLISLLLLANYIYAAPVMNNVDGVYTDDFTNNAGVPTRSYVNVNTSTSQLQLTNTTSQTSFVVPYRTSGNAITSVIKPLIIAGWDKLTINATIPENTTLKVQILSDYNSVWQDEIVPGNSAGIDVSSNPEIDISNVPIMGCAFDPVYGMDCGCDKVSSIKIKFLMTTSDTNVTPTVDNISVSWILNQGDLNPTSFSEDPWPATYGNQQNTAHTSFSNPEIYPAFKWLSDSHAGDPSYTNIWVLNDKILGSVGNSFSRFFALNRNTGEELWKIHSTYLNNGPAVIGQDGTFYAHDMLGDATKAIDTNTGNIKWLYNWMGEHGQGIVLADDGTLYYFRDSASSVNTTLVAQNPDGTIKNQTVFNVVPEGMSGEEKQMSYVTLGSGGIGYFFTYVQSTSTRQPTGKARLFAVKLDTAEIQWSYSGNFSDIAVDQNDVIYLTSYAPNYNPSKILTEKKVYALNSDGTLKWETTNDPDDGRGYRGKLLLTGNGILITARAVSYDNNDLVLIELIDSVDGSVVESFYSEDRYPYFVSSDGLGGFFYKSSYNKLDEEGNMYESRLIYSDEEGNKRWTIKYPYLTELEDLSISYGLDSFATDERGWLYGGFTKDVNDQNRDRVPSESFAKTYALAPWSLSVENDKETYELGEVVTFTVTTSMLEINPVFGGANKVQVLLDDATKIPLTYSHTDLSGETIWTGEYEIPSTETAGSYSYDVEAAQSYLKTDVVTHFDSPPAESDNSGIVVTSSIEILPDPTPTPKPKTSVPKAEVIQIPGGSGFLNRVMVTQPIKDSNTKGQSVLTIIFPETFSFNAYLSANHTSASTLSSIRQETQENTNASTNAGNLLIAGWSGGELMGFRQSNTIYWQVGSVQQIYYKAYPAEGKEAPVIIPSIQDKPSIIALKYSNSDLIPPGAPKTKFDENKLRLANSTDGINWQVISSSVVDTENKTVAAISRVGGYYVIVGRY